MHDKLHLIVGSMVEVPNSRNGRRQVTSRSCAHLMCSTATTPEDIRVTVALNDMLHDMCVGEMDFGEISFTSKIYFDTERCIYHPADIEGVSYGPVRISFVEEGYNKFLEDTHHIIFAELNKRRK